jgi:hypothetical protein
MPLIYDFKDIASRMKGELKQEPEPKEELMPPPSNSWWQARRFCTPCNGSGVNPMHGGVCSHCYGMGVVS